MGDSFSDTGVDNPSCGFCSRPFNAQFGCFHCRRDQGTGNPWDTIESRRDAIDREIKAVRSWLERAEKDHAQKTKKFRADIERLEKQLRKL